MDTCLTLRSQVTAEAYEAFGTGKRRLHLQVRLSSFQMKCLQMVAARTNAEQKSLKTTLSKDFIQVGQEWPILVINALPGKLTEALALKSSRT